LIDKPSGGLGARQGLLPTLVDHVGFDAFLAPLALGEILKDK